MKSSDRDRFTQASRIFRQHGGILRMSEAIHSGIYRRTLYSMRDTGIIERLSRGLYRLTDMLPLGNPDLVSVARKVPNAVICLISALAYHEITSQIPHQVHLAIKRRAEPPRLDHPPIRVFSFSARAFANGIEVHDIDSVAVRIYGPEKTLADCFKYRNKIGLDTAIEALKLYRQRKRLKADELVRFARICRVEKVMQPYLQALL